MQLLIASHNLAKIGEFKRLLIDLPVDLVSLDDLQITQNAPENGQTFEENAIFKAKFYHELTKLPVIADDGGLAIDFLNGEPGIKSRRWKGYRMTDEEMINSVLEALQNAPDDQRQCHLVAMIALILPGEKIITQQAQIDGIIAKEPTTKRLEGFPYRSFFWLPQFNKFLIDLTDDEHEQVNHRKISLDKLKPYLNKLTI